MKKTKLLLFLTAFIGLAGCKKDDSDDSNGNLVGKWAVTKEVSHHYINGQLESSETDTDFDANDWVLEFKADGKYNDFEDGELEEEGTYSLQNDGKKLVITVPQDVDEYTVKSLSSTDLVLYSEWTVEAGGQTHKYTEESTFKKQ
jgi:hypothetical protein